VTTRPIVVAACGLRTTCRRVVQKGVGRARVFVSATGWGILRIFSRFSSDPQLISL